MMLVERVEKFKVWQEKADLLEKNGGTTSVAPPASTLLTLFGHPQIILSYQFQWYRNELCFSFRDFYLPFK